MLDEMVLAGELQEPSKKVCLSIGQLDQVECGRYSTCLSNQVSCNMIACCRPSFVRLRPRISLLKKLNLPELLNKL